MSSAAWSPATARRASPVRSGPGKDKAEEIIYYAAVFQFSVLMSTEGHHYFHIEDSNLILVLKLLICSGGTAVTLHVL